MSATMPSDNDCAIIGWHLLWHSTHHTRFGERAFCVSGPSHWTGTFTWNSPCRHLSQTFKKNL